MTTIGKDFPVRSDAFRFSSEKRASSAATSPARTECFDIFSAEPGDSDVTSQMERLSSKEMKIAARLDWMAVGASCRSATAGMVVSRVSVRNLTLPERWSLSTSPWDLSDWHFRRGLGRAAGDFGELRRPSRLDRLHSRLSGRSGVASEACSAGWDAWATVTRGGGQPGARTNNRLRFHAMVTRLQSARTLSRPRNENWRNPSADLMMPNTG